MNEIEIISFNRFNLGSIIKTSKKEYVWVIKYQNKIHSLRMVNSIIKMKYSVYLNQQRIAEQNSKDLDLEFIFADFKIKLTKTFNQRPELFINGKPIEFEKEKKINKENDYRSKDTI